MQEFDIEDFSAMILDFGDGVGLLEGSWSTLNSGEVPSGPIIHGTEGTIVCDHHSYKTKLYKGRYHGLNDPVEVYDYEGVPSAMNVSRNILDHLEHGTPLHPLLDPILNVQAMAVLVPAANPQIPAEQWIQNLSRPDICINRTSQEKYLGWFCCVF